MPDVVILKQRYRLEERLGAGGMALVYRARDLELERAVAIKILRENFNGDEEFRQRFRQEARAAANLAHSNIVTVHDFGIDQSRLFIVMEYVPGTNLKELLQQRGRLPEAEAIELMVQACAGVGYAHRAGLAHCDIKPLNLLITPDKRLKVTDFGIARALANIQPDERSEVVWGSPQYFAPEQAAGGPPSPASDVYSLGVILYEMLTGRLPFSAETPGELARLHRDQPPPPPGSFNAEISPALEQIILKVLAKEPAARYRTADQFGRVLAAFGGAGATVSAAAAASGGEAATAAPRVVSDTAPRRLLPLAPAADEDAPPNPLAVDWVTLGLALLAVLAVGGLFPLSLWFYYRFFGG